jgi:hypothetical protein
MPAFSTGPAANAHEQSAGRQQSVKDTDTEPQSVYRHSLVDAMEQGSEVQICGQQERRESEASNSEGRERLRVGTAAQQVWHRMRARVFGPKR